jgi:hypothetical protein
MRKRRAASGLRDRRILIATGHLRVWSLAKNTSAMPPFAIRRTIR